MSLNIVLPSGRLLNKSKEYFIKSGIEIKEPEGRKLTNINDDYSFFYSRVFDVPVYVENGIDIGICGLDVVLERNNDVYIPLKLPFGKCRMSVIVEKEKDLDVSKMEGYTIATKFPNITQKFFDSIGVKVKTIKLHGAIELAVKTGVADAIVDIVDTGRTLKENGLKEIENIKDISSVLIVNRISMKRKNKEIKEIIKNLKEVSK
jgi:ATP phosphoribosyltransferase